MPFRPYHCFGNRPKLEKLITVLNEGGGITTEAFNNFNCYNPAMIHKLKSAKYNLDALADKLTSTNIQEAAVQRGEFRFEVNMFIDGFFYNSCSALDILARVVLTLFGEPLTGSIYFHTAHSRLSRSRLGDPILPRLENPSWLAKFSDYRNALTHELILSTKYQIEFGGTGDNQEYKIVFPLPDDPRAEPQARKYKKYPNVMEFAKTHLTRILRLANTIYGDIASRAEVSSALPL